LLRAPERASPVFPPKRENAGFELGQVGGRAAVRRIAADLEGWPLVGQSRSDQANSALRMGIPGFSRRRKMPLALPLVQRFFDLYFKYHDFLTNIKNVVRCSKISSSPTNLD
jgi:hypothetical protein